MKVFEFNCRWESDMKKSEASGFEYSAEVVYRYVVAETEEEAEEKMQAYSDKLVEDGCDRLVFFSNPVVEMENVIA